MPVLSMLLLALTMLLQTPGVSSIPGSILTPGETAQLEREQDIQRRIKVYEKASTRIQKSLEGFILKDDFRPVPDTLQQWTALLSKSLEDIEANLKMKKKSRALISYEIQVRKSIARTESLKIRAPVNQQEAFDFCLARAEAVRKKFVAILFRP